MSAKPADIHAFAAEQALLGALMSNGDNWQHVGEELTAAHFYDKRNQIIFAAAKKLADTAHPDWALLLQAIKNNGQLREAGGEDYLADLAGIAGSAVNIPGYVEQINNTAISRALVATAAELTASAQHPGDQTPAAIASDAAARLELIATSGAPMDIEPLSVVLERWRKRPNKMGIHTGILSLTKSLLGLQNGQVYIIGGLPYSGKTILGMQFANQADRALIFALDTMPAICAEMVGDKPHAQIDITGIARPAPDLANAAIAWRRKQPASAKCLILFDYIQLMHPTRRKDNKHNEMEQVMAALKLTARRTNAVVVAISALSKSDRYGDKNPRPNLSALRDSSSLEYAPDNVMFLHQAEKNEPGKKNPKREIIIAKNRMTYEQGILQVKIVAREGQSRRIIAASAKDGETGNLTPSAKNDAHPDGFNPPTIKGRHEWKYNPNCSAVDLWTDDIAGFTAAAAYFVDEVKWEEGTAPPKGKYQYSARFQIPF